MRKSAATLEATVQPVEAEEPTLEATEVPPTPEPTPEPVAAYEPVFESIDCWFTLPESQPVECGYLVVPEDRTKPDGNQVRIATANSTDTLAEIPNPTRSLSYMADLVEAH